MRALFVTTDGWMRWSDVPSNRPWIEFLHARSQPAFSMTADVVQAETVDRRVFEAVVVTNGWWSFTVYVEGGKRVADEHLKAIHDALKGDTTAVRQAANRAMDVMHNDRTQWMVRAISYREALRRVGRLARRAKWGRMRVRSARMMGTV